MISLISYSLNGRYELPREATEALINGSALPYPVLKRVNHVAWYPGDYASLKRKVTLEKEE